MSMTAEADLPRAEGFDAYFDQQIAPELEAMETRRKSGVRLLVALGILAALGVLTFFLADRIVAFTGFDRNLVMMGGLAFVLCGVLGGIVVYRRVHGAFKEVLVGRTCDFLGLDFASRGFSFPFERFERAGLMPTHDTRKLEDRIAGTHEGVSFELCEAQLEQNHDDDEDDSDDDNTVFHGLLLIYSFQKPFEGETVVMPDATWLGNKLVGMTRRGDRVTLEDVRFEKQFEVYSTDQVEARYILTPRFMERMSELAGQFGNRRGLSMAFTGNDLLIAVRSSKDRFEGGSIFKSFADPERAKELVAELTQIFMVIDVLNLTDTSRA